MSKAVINGMLQHLSVTAITAFDPKEFGGCNRRWWFKYVAGLPEEPQLSQITGAKIHKAIEGFLLKGTPVASPVVEAGAHFLPQMSDDILVELPTAGVLTAAGIPMKGFIDVYNRSPIYIDSMGQIQSMSPRQVEVLDWKTTSNLNYAKSGKELLTTQMVGYAKFAVTSQPELESVRLSHVYFSTKGRPASVKNSTIIHLDNIIEKYQGIEHVAEQIKQVALEAEAVKVPANRASCSAYRGCPFINSCPQDSTQGANMAESMLEKLRRAKAAQTNTPAPVTIDPQLEAEVDAVQADYTQTIKTLGPCPQCCQMVSADQGSLTPSGRIVHLGCKGVAIIPPDAPKPLLLAGQAKAAEVLAADPNKLAERPVLEAAPKKTRGPNKPKVESPNDEGRDQAIPRLIHPEPSALFELFVDVRVRGKSPLALQPLEPFIEEAKQALADQAGIPDLRLADTNSPLGYGKWEAFLALQLVSMVLEGKLSGRFTLSDVKESKIKQVALEAVSSHCTLLVRGY